MKSYPNAPKDKFYFHRLTEIGAWIWTHTHCFVWCVITHPYPIISTVGGLLFKPPLKLEPQFYVDMISYTSSLWWRHQKETFSVSMALCEGNSPVTGGFPSQRQVTRSFGAFYDLRWTNGGANNQDPGDLRPHRAHYDVFVMQFLAGLGNKVELGNITSVCKQNKHIFRSTSQKYAQGFICLASLPLYHISL